MNFPHLPFPAYCPDCGERIPEGQTCPCFAGQAAGWKRIGYAPYCHTDGNDCIAGEFRMDEFDEKPFEVATPAHWECRSVYLGAVAPTPQED